MRACWNSIDSRKRLRWLLLLWVAVILCGRSRGQAPGQETKTLHVNAQLVLVDVSVEQRKTGKPITGLSAGDFVVEEDGRPETLNSVSEDVLPLSVVLMFDLTDTVHPVLQHLAGSAAEVLRHLRPQDEVAVMTFSSHARLEQRFTRDRMTAVEGIDAASASYDQGEPTFVYEDLWEAARQSETSRLPEARRVQVWVTDGSANDQDTQRGMAHHAPAVLHMEAEASEALLRSGAVVSALIEKSGLHGTGHFGDVERLAALTGGPVLYATEGDAAMRMASLLDTLRLRYTLGYRPGEDKPPGTVCRLRVGLSPQFWAQHPKWKPKDLTVRSRQSYLR